MDPDYELAKELQKQFNMEYNVENPPINLSYHKRRKRKNEETQTPCLIDPSWELIDPTPNIHDLFVTFNTRFFWGALCMVSVGWSKKMSTCAGICSYNGNGYCFISLSEKLLKLRPRKDLVETLLHEMIHAYLFITNNKDSRQAHGPEFHRHMYRINKEAGTNITVYHDFHDEVRLYKRHVWRCNGPCVKQPPYYGTIRRAMDRAPNPHDFWWNEHQYKCGGTFIKIASPETTKLKQQPKKSTNATVTKIISPDKSKPKSANAGDIRKFITTTKVSNNSTRDTVIKENSNVTNKYGKENRPEQNPKQITVGKPVDTTLKNTSQFFGKGNNVGKTNNAADSVDYIVVRNHWLNKYNQTDDKPKRMKMNDDSNNNNFNRTTCPVCKNIMTSCSCPVQTSSSLTKEVVKLASCPVCGVMVDENIMNEHLDECLFRQNVTENASNTTNQPTKICELCDMPVPENEYYEHICECLRMYSEVLDEKPESTEDTVFCLVCNKSLLKSALPGHLEDCMVYIFDDDM